MKSLSKSVEWGFLLLFSLTPLIFTSFNSELFELPKMYFVYAITLLILTLHLVNVWKNKTSLLSLNLSSIFVLLFLLSQIISTIFSVDRHTSVYGYYSRLNGGLLPLVCYLILYFILSVYIDAKLTRKIINISLASGLIVALYAVAEHFGIDKNIWVQDVQNRVFSTFGQPNWLAAYLCILIPLSFVQALESFHSKNKLLSFIFQISTVIFFIALLFTKSKSGLIAAVFSLGLFCIISVLKNKNSFKFLILNSLILIILSLSINNPIKDLLFPQKISNSSLEISNLNVTPSEDIRKIVWRGAIDLWRKFPVFGTGVETFAYSYYWTRPAEHNLTSEWDFLYNKAHNEYINYLATTGIFGLTVYTLLIAAFIFTMLKSIFRDQQASLLNSAVLAAFVSILITNIAGFSVVVISLYFFLLPVFTARKNQFYQVSFSLPKPLASLLTVCTLILSLFVGQKILYYYLADISYAVSSELDDKGQYQSAYDQIKQSLVYRSNEPVYLDKASSEAAKLVLVAHSQQNKELEDRYIRETESYSNQALIISPANINFWKERAQNYYYLAMIDPLYLRNSIDAMSKAIALAPTDAKSFYLMGKFLETAKLTDKAEPFFRRAIELKSNYDYAYFELGKINYDAKNYTEAKRDFELVLKYAPDSRESQDYLSRIKASP